MWLSLLLVIHGIFATTVHNENILNNECETNFNCRKFMANAICFDKKCICPFGHTLNGCVPEIKQTRYHRQTNMGMRMLGEPCDWTNQCRRLSTDETKVCLARKCQCSRGYIPMDAYRCLKDTVILPSKIRISKATPNEPLGFGSTCSTAIDCQQISMHLECIHEVCVCLEGYVPLGKYLCYNIRGPEDSTRTSTLSITPSTINSISNDVLKTLGKIGNSCFNDYFCRRTISESHCYNGKCACIDGYRSIDQYTCMKDMNRDTTIKSTPIPFDYKSLLGGKCSTKRNCHTSNAVCLNSICFCPRGYFPVDDWTCLEEPELSDEELIQAAPIMTTTIPLETTRTTAIFSTTTIFRWWPWSPTPTTYPTFSNLENAFRVRCLLNRQCANMDSNSHCTLFGRCVCNRGYILKTTNRGQFCAPRILSKDDCD
ncbi:unnamed protein product [Rotaria magnacalcarata]|uniref:EGF-like domain-containing protein n=1 Tax=Rotaria magnacalcarata TaxID=392030 RepID=A0A814FMN2_9BILA|nr:unnamed protein product [Rotaria magnacalcarata]